MATGAAIAAVCGLLLALLQLWSAKAPARKQEDVDETILQGRTDIANGNANAVSTRIDGLLAGQTGASDNLAGVGNGTAAERNASALRRLAALGIGSDETPRKSRKL